ncbi:MAG: hypothetical protein CM15mP120_14390 [Pseudomonadota bacterium]|nr:MAG: hypothetical protein CM15mP120_14390 [Pseudomonadota bacterium]
MKNLSQGDLGISYTQENRRVNDIIREHFPVSATLGILAVVFAGLGGVLWERLLRCTATDCRTPLSCS